MEYVIPIVLVVLIIGLAITFGVFRVMQTQDPAGRPADQAPGIGPDKSTPLGDSSEHSEVPSDEDARSPAASPSGEPGGDGRFTGSRLTGVDPSTGGEDDGQEHDEPRPSRPRSEQLGNADRSD